MVRVEAREFSDQNGVDFWYKQLLQDILKNGVKKTDRTGTGTLSVFGRTFRHKMSEGFPLLTTKKMYTKGVLAELLWFLRGSTDIRELWKDNCHIWDGDWYKRYAASTPNPLTIAQIEAQLATPEGAFLGDTMFDLGPIYGKQWRRFGPVEHRPLMVEKLCEGAVDLDELHEGVIDNACEVLEPSETITQLFNGYDQISYLISELRFNPDSRRLMVTAWNPLDLEKQILPPCHYGFQCYTRELSLEERTTYYKERYLLGVTGDLSHLSDEQLSHLLNSMNIPKRELSLSWNQRSVDVPLGLPFNIASYGFLLHILADAANMVPGELIGNLGDTHIYTNQIEGVKEQLQNIGKKLPTLSIDYKDEVFGGRSIYTLRVEDFKLEGYESAGKINYPLSN